MAKYGAHGMYECHVYSIQLLLLLFEQTRIQVLSTGHNIVTLQLLNRWLHVMNTAVVSAVMVYMLLKTIVYSDKGCIPKKLAQSVFESGLQSVPCFSHVLNY